MSATRLWNFPTGQLVRDDGNGMQGLQDWLAQVTNLLSGLTLSGTTTERPTKNLYVGRMYFDTTLGKPIWLKTAAPVWVDAAGGAV